MLLRLSLLALTFFPLATRTCDLCGCYTPQPESMPKEKVSLTGFYTAVSEQFTHFGSLQFDDREVANPTGELAAEFPVLMNTTAFQAVPDYRLHASVAVNW
jgi:hypothetical protein